jgi:hypothetical protein
MSLLLHPTFKEEALKQVRARWFWSKNTKERHA